MTQRYVTEGEKAGQLRRMTAYRQRLECKGIRPRQFLLNDAENDRFRNLLALWRGESHDLNDAQSIAGSQLRPASKVSD